MDGKKRQLKLPTHLLDQLSGDNFNDQRWRESHNMGGKRKSRKESRKEQRQAKKQKNNNHYRKAEADSDSTVSKQRESAEKDSKSKKDSKNSKKPSKLEAKKEPAKALKSDKIVRPFANAHEEDLKRKDEEDAKYYAKKLGLKSLKLKDNEDDGLGDILGDLDFDNFSDSQSNEDIDNLEETDGELEYSDASSAAGDDAIGDVYSDDNDDDDENDEELTAEETMRKLANLKKNKGSGSGDIRVVKEDDLESDDSISDFGDSEEDEDEEMSADETMRRLAAAKKGKSSDNLKVVKEDELESDDSVSDLGESEEDEDENNDEEVSAEETMRKLAAKKGKPSDDWKVVKEDELEPDDSLSDFSDEGDEDDDVENEDENDEDEISAEETMRRLAAAKKGKSSGDMRIVKEDELESDDSISDFGGSEEDDDEEMSVEETMRRLAAAKKGKSSENLKVVKEADLESDEGSDFGESGFSDESDAEGMTAEETMAKLAALKAKKNGKSVSKAKSDSKSDSEVDSDAESDSDSDSDSDEDENPYVPPTRRGEPEKKASEVKQDSEAVQKMRRAFKGSLNKLTESTLTHVSNEINLTFMKNSRAEASEVLTSELLELVGGPQPLQATLYSVYAGLVASLYQTVGIAFAAHFIQTLVETIFNGSTGDSNLLSLLVECYSFQVISSRLLYDIMKRLLNDISSAESLKQVELLLVVIRNGGSQLRSDDPVALKEVIVLLQQRMQDLGGDKALTPRMRFLVDAIVALKNNRQKPVSELVVSLRHRIRKTLLNGGGSGKKNKSGSSEASKEAMQVGLNDILDSKTRGKWWLVGASWKGQSSAPEASDAGDKLDIDLDDEFGAASVDWLELAKKQRLNTDVRRAVFVALMGAEDYLDACLRIDKLGLKNKQERDIPHVILHCLVQEPYYNPYYMLVASKQCGRHSTMKTFQFRLWDWFSSEPSGSPQTAMHYGRFYANLVCQKSIPLDVLKQADFLGASSDTQIFLDVFFVTFYKDMAKAAEKEAKNKTHRGLAHIAIGNDDTTDRDGRELALLLKKVQDPKVLRGIQIINKSINASEALRTDKEKARVRWASQFTSDLIEELVHRVA